jgi:ATP-dependent Lon protease
MTLASFVAFASSILQKPLQSQMIVLGDMRLGGSIVPVENLAKCLQVAFDAGAKRILIPMSSAIAIPTIPAELFTKFQTSLFSDPIDAVFKAFGID